MSYEVATNNSESSLQRSYEDYILDKVGARSYPIDRQYWRLFRDLFDIPFKVVLQKDINRLGDVDDFRMHFCNEMGYETITLQEASFLEVLVSLAVRMEDILHEPCEGDRAGIWFLELLDNSGLGIFTDDNITVDYKEEMEYIVHRIIKRTYDRNGSGGLFPMDRPAKDQRRTELWYQLNAYLLEKYYTDDE